MNEDILERLACLWEIATNLAKIHNGDEHSICVCHDGKKYFPRLVVKYLFKITDGAFADVLTTVKSICAEYSMDYNIEVRPDGVGVRLEVGVWDLKDVG